MPRYAVTHTMIIDAIDAQYAAETADGVVKVGIEVRKQNAPLLELRHAVIVEVMGTAAVEMIAPDVLEEGVM